MGKGRKTFKKPSNFTPSGEAKPEAVIAQETKNSKKSKQGQHKGKPLSEAQRLLILAQLGANKGNIVPGLTTDIKDPKVLKVRV